MAWVDVGSAMYHQVDETRNPNQVVPNKSQSIRKLANANNANNQVRFGNCTFPV